MKIKTFFTKYSIFRICKSGFSPFYILQYAEQRFPYDIYKKAPGVRTKGQLFLEIVVFFLR